MQYISHYQSPMGEILLAADEIGLTGLWFEGQKYFALYLNRRKRGLISISLEGSRTVRCRSTLSALIFKMRYGKSSIPYHTDRL